MALPNLVRDKYKIGAPANPKLAGLQADAATAASDAKRANSPLTLASRTITGIPRVVGDEAKSFATGAAEFGLSAGEAPARLISPRLSTAVLPATTIPGLKGLGPVQSFQSRTAQAVQDGENPLAAIGQGTLDTVINDPAGVAFKPLVVAAGVGVKALKASGALDSGIIARLIKGGKSALAKPAVQATDEFAGMTLPERLAATAERKVPVTGDTTLRPLPVAGGSVATDVPFANDYRSQANLPVIKAGGRAATEPVIQADARVSRGTAAQDLTYEPVSPVPASTVANTAPAAVSGRTVAQMGPVDMAAAPVRTPLPPQEAVDGMKQSGLARGVEATAIEKKLTDGLGDLSQYQTINIKDQAEKAASLITNNYEKAKNIALGIERAPEGMHDFAVYTAVADKATKEGDVDTLRALATRSTLNAESSQAAQTLRLLAERDPESPLSAIASVVKAREAMAARKGMQSIPNAIKTEMKAARAASKKVADQSWDDFIDTLTC